jgi:nicotinamide phosphoribosyltransferase
MSLVFKTDSYKVSHWLQFPEDVKKTFYYIESRSKNEIIKFFGLQAILKKNLFDIPTKEDVEMADKFWTAHGLPFNKEGWLKLVDLGYYPLEIKAIPEGSIIPTGNVLVTITNTVDGFEWLPGWFETLLLQVWYPITVCTKSYQCKKVIEYFLDKTGDPSLINFKLHDFGYRGVSSQESAELGGMAHLVNFMGTDTVAGIFAAQKYYNTDEMIGFSIPAAEHSTMTAWGKENEVNAYKNMLNKFAKKNALVAVVSDSYDLENAVENIWGKELKEQVLESGATIVIRPDSGEPKDIVLRTLEQLDKLFGYTLNKKSYKVLNPAVRVIQGDGIGSAKDIYDILLNMEKNRYSTDNIAFGMGGGLLQQVNRDTRKFAMKCSAVQLKDNTWKDVFKCPKDAEWKKSKAGRLVLTSNMKTVRMEESNENILETVFKNGEMVKEYTFKEVRGF